MSDRPFTPAQAEELMNLFFDAVKARGDVHCGDLAALDASNAANKAVIDWVYDRTDFR